MASFTRSGFRPAGIVRSSPNEVLDSTKACAYSHKPVIGRVEARAIHYYDRWPAGAESAVVQVLLQTCSHTPVFTWLYLSDHLPQQRQYLKQ